MKTNYHELIARITVLLLLIGTPIIIYSYAPWKTSENKRVIFLSAVASQGIWTEDLVNGLNYWNKDFKRAKIILKEGESVLFRFTSIDVTHTFYVPELGIGPVEVLPGHLYEFEYKATKTGLFQYYCTTVCGHCHFYMQGDIIVEALNNKTINDSLYLLSSDTSFTKVCVNHLKKYSKSNSIVENGKNLFLEKACYTCHGFNGVGGIRNFNYAKDSIPQLNNLSEKLKIPYKEDADSIIKLLSLNIKLESLEENPPFDKYERFLAQYQSITKKIIDGAEKLQKKDSLGLNPPLFMPSWENSLSQEEINSLIAYLITLNNWEDD